MGLPWCGSALKNLPAVQEMWEIQAWSLSWEDPLEKEMATHSSILFWKTPGQRRLAGYSPWGCRVRHDWETEHSNEWGGMSFQVLDSCIARHMRVLFQVLFRYKLLWSVEGSLCYAVGPCGWFYKEWCVYVNLDQLIFPCPPLFLLGNHTSVRLFLFGKEVHLSPFLDST